MKTPIINGYITHGFNEPREFDGKQIIHGGYDIGSKDLKPVVNLMYKSSIVARGLSKSYGFRVWAKIIDGPLKGLYMVYGHLEKINSIIQPGITFNEGEQLGIMGNTGYSQGRHLHLGCEDSVDGKGIKHEIPELQICYPDSYLQTKIN